MHEEQLVDRVSLLRFTPLAGSEIYKNPDRYGINPSTLSVENFDKTYLYRDSFNWWNSEEMKQKRDCWFNDMKGLIDKFWPDS